MVWPEHNGVFVYVTVAIMHPPNSPHMGVFPVINILFRYTKHPLNLWNDCSHTTPLLIIMTRSGDLHGSISIK